LDIYRAFPCRTLPNAYWKTASRMDEGELDIQYGSEGELKSLTIWQEKTCQAYWCANPSECHLTSAKLDQLTFALVHDKSLIEFQGRQFKRAQAFFRLCHDGGVKKTHCPPGYIIRGARPDVETEVVSKMIQRCYANMEVTPETVRGWLDHPTYDPSLWVWIIDASVDRKVGLGIAEIDEGVPEASLEWIQVLPHYQQQGLGSAIVAELLHRLEGKVCFTTVSGELDNHTRPERLYRKCGFNGSDVWWLLRF